MHGSTRGLRELAKRYLALALSAQQADARALWRAHNALQGTRPPIYVRAVPYREFFDERVLQCEDPLLRRYEYDLATKLLFHRTLADDFIHEPWLTIDAVTEPFDDRWGVSCALGEKPGAGGAAAFAPSLRAAEDLAKLRARPHVVDERATAARAEKLADAVGDILPIHIDRRGALARMWTMDISTDLAKLRGLTQIMYDLYDCPEWLHALVGRMRDAILANIDQTEAAGDFSLADHQNQAMPYAADMEDPNPNARGVSAKRLWCFMASQETTTFGPAQFDEFMLAHQKPIIARFGLCAYGCCEDLTQKIPLLRTIPNLRRIAVSPFANLARCAEQIGGDYVLSYRPDPSFAFATGLHEEAVRGQLRADFAVLFSNGCKFDVTMKDVETIAGRPQDMIRWVQIVREEAERAAR